MSVAKRQDIVGDLIKALEKRFRVTNLTGAMKTALSQLKLECLSDLPEFKDDVMAALIKIREAEENDTFYPHLPGYFEEHDLPKYVLRMCNKIFISIDEHV